MPRQSELETTASTSGRVTRMRRYLITAAAIGAALVAVYFSFQTLFDQQNLIVKQSKINMWFLAQTQLEYERLMRELDKFAPKGQDADGDALSERFDIFWSRLPILIEGPQSAELRAVDGLRQNVLKIIEGMKKAEPKIAALAGGDRGRYNEVSNLLQTFRPPLEDLIQNALLYDSRLDSTYRKAHQIYFYQLLAVFAAMLAGGTVLFFMLYRQTRRANVLFVKASDAERSASVARAQLLEAIDSISEGFILYDQDDRVILLNDRYKVLHRHLADCIHTGATFEEIIRQALERGLIMVEPGRVEAWLKECIAKHRAPGGAFEHNLKDGRWLKISERRTADGRIVGVHTDITDIKRRELELIDKSALLQATLDNMSEGICVFDAARRLIGWNERFIEMHKLPQGVVRFGRLYDELARYTAERGEATEAEADRFAAEQVAQIVNMQRSGQKRLRFERRRAEGSVIEITITPTPDGGFVKTYSDITDRVVAEEEREKLLERFHATQKMEAIGTLAGGVAHDFNNILGIILGYCDLLSDEIPKVGSAGEMLHQISQAGERAKLLVQQILTYSRNFDCTLEPCDIAGEVRNSLELLRTSLPANVELTLEKEEACTAAADRAQIHQILLNLVVNSVHAIGDRPGTVAVAVEIARPGRPEEPGQAAAAMSRRKDVPQAWRASRIVLGIVKDVPYCRIGVRDTGGGIDPLVINRIFEPFFTTKEVGKGTGLGLAVVYGIVRNHDGIIEVESVLGQGVTFNIYLPLLEARRAIEPPAKDPRALKGNERILLVDDDAILLSVQKGLLEKLGYRVTEFRNPATALESFRATPEAWDLIVTDRNMALMDGEQFARSVLQARSDMPVIMCTGYLDLADENRILGSGVRDIVMKPVTGPKLSSSIRAVLQGQPRPALARVRSGSG